MASLLEVLHQNSLSMRDPQAVSQELDLIVRQSEDSERAVREMEALLRSAGGDWLEAREDAALPASTQSPQSSKSSQAGPIRPRVQNQ